MKKSIITLIVVLCGVLSSNAQDLKPGYAKTMERVVSERIEVCGMDEEQEKAFRANQKERFLEIQQTAEIHQPGSDEFKAVMKEVNKKYNKFYADLTTLEQKKKWQEYVNAKKANK